MGTNQDHAPLPYPNFIILGAAKAGTTALYHYMRQHPQVYLTPLKETNFFALENEPLNFSGPGDDQFINYFSITNLEAYQGQFEGARDEIAVGEASPLYLYSARAAERIQQYVPDARLIIILRHPIERAYSAFAHLVRDGRETTNDFATALRQEDERVRAGWEHIWHYRSMSLYYQQVKRYYDLFDAQQIQVWLYRDFRTEPCPMMSKVFRFLGVDEDFVPDVSTRYNEASQRAEPKPPLLADAWNVLYEAFYDETFKLEELIGRDLSHWRSTTSKQLDLSSV